MKLAVVVTICFLSFVAVVHVLRLVFGVTVTVGSFAVPMWASIMAVIGPSALAAWLWSEHQK